MEKKYNFWQFLWKKSQVFGNFLTFKWQFSGGSGPIISRTYSLNNIILEHLRNNRREKFRSLSGTKALWNLRRHSYWRQYHIYYIGRLGLTFEALFIKELTLVLNCVCFFVYYQTLSKRYWQCFYRRGTIIQEKKIFKNFRKKTF